MRVLLLCESTHNSDSGGRVVRYLAKLLKENNIEVKMVVISEKREDYSLDTFYKNYNVEFLPFRKKFWFRFANLFLLTREVTKFREILKKFSPDVVHFASFDIGKPSRFISDAKKSGATVILQPWTMIFFCAQGFGFRDSKKCTLCASGKYINALTHRCVSVRGIPSLIKRKWLHRQALKADIFLSSNDELDSILLLYGVDFKKIKRFPIPFDYTQVKRLERPEGNYFIYYGQPTVYKGLNILRAVFKNLPDQNLKVYPLSFLPTDSLRSENIEVINGVRWANGLGEAVASSKAVLVPSLWSSSTEYSLCEALLYKKPVVVFNVGVHKHIFINGINALVIDQGDIKAYEEAIVKLDSNFELRKTIGENGYNTLLNINKPEKVFSQLFDAYIYKT